MSIRYGLKDKLYPFNLLGPKFEHVYYWGISLYVDHFINSTGQRHILEVFHSCGSSATHEGNVIFSGYEKLQVEASSIPPEI